VQDGDFQNQRDRSQPADDKPHDKETQEIANTPTKLPSIHVSFRANKTRVPLPTLWAYARKFDLIVNLVSYDAT
jgi:hypothetical protein